MPSFQHKHFDIETRIELRVGELSWPKRGEAADESGLGLNRSYFDLRGISWRTVAEMMQVEGALIERIVTAADPTAEADAVEEEMNEAWDGHPLWGLDLGVAGTAHALSAAGCIPFTSCNAGAFGTRHHHEHYPIVAFYLRPKWADAIADAARAVGAGLHQHEDGTLHVYGETIVHVTNFGAELYARRNSFRKRSPFGMGSVTPPQG